MDKAAEAARSGMDVVIELDNDGRIWVSHL